MKRLAFILCFCAFPFIAMQAQDSFDDILKSAMQEFNAVVKGARDEYQKVREEADREYAQAIKEAWDEYSAFKAIEAPKEKPVVPVKYEKKEQQQPSRKLPVKENRVVEAPKPKKVVPVAVPLPVEEKEAPSAFVPVKKEEQAALHRFSFYGSQLEVAAGAEHKFTLRSLSEENIANAWASLGHEKYKGLLESCLKVRSSENMCDWAYLTMLNKLSDSLFGGRCNESTMLAAYLFAQSGYKMRLAKSGSTLYLLYSTNYTVFSKNYWKVDGDSYYLYGGNATSVNICRAKYDKEQSMSMQITKSPRFVAKSSGNRALASKRYPEAAVSVYANKNLLEFFNDYPAAGIGNEKWTVHANAPMSAEVKASLYPTLKKAIAGKSEIDALNCLLNFVQTAFVYEYDDKVWGEDRVFFAEETLYYPYADCEDRSILFARLVRDLMGLDVVLLHYTGHLATAVKCTQRQQGDYVTVGSANYLVCDPTYINAPAGNSMPEVAQMGVTVIKLN